MALEAAFSESGEAGMLRWLIESRRPDAENWTEGHGGDNRALNMALLHARLAGVEGSSTDEAFRWLEASLRRRDGVVIYTKGHPSFDSLRTDPRFDAVLEQLGLV